MGPSGLDREIGAVHCGLNSQRGHGLRSLRVVVVDTAGTRCSASDFARPETTVPVLWTADWWLSTQPDHVACSSVAQSRDQACSDPW